MNTTTTTTTEVVTDRSIVARFNDWGDDSVLRFTKHTDGTMSVRAPEALIADMVDGASRTALSMQCHVGPTDDMVETFRHEEKFWEAAKVLLERLRGRDGGSYNAAHRDANVRRIDRWVDELRNLNPEKFKGFAPFG